MLLLNYVILLIFSRRRILNNALLIGLVWLILCLLMLVLILLVMIRMLVRRHGVKLLRLILMVCIVLFVLFTRLRVSMNMVDFLRLLFFRLDIM